VWAPEHKKANVLVEGRNSLLAYRPAVFIGNISVIDYTIILLTLSKTYFDIDLVLRA
jgi:hypothetical protein